MPLGKIVNHNYQQSDGSLNMCICHLNYESRNVGARSVIKPVARNLVRICQVLRFIQSWGHQQTWFTTVSLGAIAEL